VTFLSDETDRAAMLGLAVAQIVIAIIKLRR
jgi:hypothetical protein